MNIAFVTATAKEMKSALAALQLGVDIPQRGGLTLNKTSGRLDLIVTGIGPVNAALEIGKYLERNRDVDVIFNIGIAGSFDFNKAKLGDIVYVTDEIYPEFGLATSAGVTTDQFSFHQFENESGRIDQSIALHPEELAAQVGFLLPDSWRAGSSLTVAGVSADPQRAKQLETMHQPLLENMEGFSIAFACYVQKKQFFEIRTVSNRVGSREKSDWRIKDALSGLTQVGQTIFKAFFSE